MPERVISLTPEEVNRMLASGEMKILSTPSGIDYAQPDADKPWPQTEEARKLIGLGYTRKQAAFSIDELIDKTRVYAGPLVNKDPNGEIIPIFEKLNSTKLILAPEGVIKIEELVIGGKNKNQLMNELGRNNFKVGSGAKDMMNNEDFKTLSNSQTIKLIKLPIKALGFDADTVTDQIYRQADLLGLDLCPAEVGPHLRLKDTDQPLKDRYWVGMKQIPNWFNQPSIFALGYTETGMWLDSSWTSDDGLWDPGVWIVFSFRNGP